MSRTSLTPSGSRRPVPAGGHLLAKSGALARLSAVLADGPGARRDGDGVRDTV